MTENDDGPGVTTPRPVTTTQNAAHQHPDRRTRSLPVASATRHRRSGRARFPRDAARCPLCGFTHWHVPFEGASSYKRSPACRPWTVYTVQVVRLVPDAVVVGAS
jgi:hypothetical protein